MVQFIVIMPHEVEPMVSKLIKYNQVVIIFPHVKQVVRLHSI